MKHIVISLEEHGIAKKAGLRVNDALLAINDEPIIDEIDYQALSSPSKIVLTVQREGKVLKLPILKQEGDPLGIHFGKSLCLSPRTCRNRCTFCFVDQLPPRMRKTLYVKDDDWRYSLMMGNFVTLTNISDEEFERIIRRKASPLFVSVHATDSKVREKMIKHGKTDEILDKLKRFKQEGIAFHCQIVVCPGVNDGEVLKQTITDLMALAPAAKTMALVPVGLTKYRNGLEELTPFTKETARNLFSQIAPLQQKCRETIGTTFVFPSDELFCIAKLPLPSDEWYEGYPQIENGVGLFRKLESELLEAQEFDELPKETKRQRVLWFTGVSAAPHLQEFIKTFASPCLDITLSPVINQFFGDTITVTGLLTATDLRNALINFDLTQFDCIWISSVMLRHEGDLFLDDVSITDFCNQVPIPVSVIETGGEALYEAFQGR